MEFVPPVHFRETELALARFVRQVKSLLQAVPLANLRVKSPR